VAEKLESMAAMATCSRDEVRQGLVLCGVGARRAEGKMCAWCSGEMQARACAGA
jgi:hypothetical protein